AGRFRLAGVLAGALEGVAAGAAFQRAFEERRRGVAEEAASARGRMPGRVSAEALCAECAHARGAGSGDAPARVAAVQFAPGSDGVRLPADAEAGAPAAAGGDLPAGARARRGR